MEVTIKGTPNEIADIVFELQCQPTEQFYFRPLFIRNHTISDGDDIFGEYEERFKILLDTATSK